MAYYLDPPEQVSLPILGRPERFAVRRIYCCASNYPLHIQEMGGTVQRDAPYGFLKPADALVAIEAGQIGSMRHPASSQNLHHEVELVVALGRGGRDLSVQEAEAAIVAYAVGLDMTCRDLQQEAKSKGRPWDAAKAFDESAPISALRLRESDAAPLQGGNIQLTVNGQERQSGDLADMLWSPAEIIAHFSRHWEFRAGDLVFTGTPHGVGPVKPGDLLEARIEGVGQLSVRIVSPTP